MALSREEQRAYGQAYYQRNKEKMRAQNRAWFEQQRAAGRNYDKERTERLRQEFEDQWIGLRPLCGCGCGEITPLATKTYKHRGIVAGQPLRFLPAHSLRVVREMPNFEAKRIAGFQTWESRQRRSRASRKGTDPIISPYLPEVLIFQYKNGYWGTKLSDGRVALHHRLVCERFHGSIPDGFEVHHRNNVHGTPEDDAPENLVAVPRKWNRDYIPMFIEELGLTSEYITDVYLEVRSQMSEELHFREVCRRLIDDQPQGFKLLRVAN